MKLTKMLINSRQKKIGLGTGRQNVPLKDFMKRKKSLNDIKPNEIWDSENIFHLKTDISRIGKLIYHYEFYKKILNVPGDIVECGVFKGISLIRFLTYRSILENNNSRKVYGFDSFGKFPSAENPDDKEFIKKWENSAGDGISKDELNKILLEKKFENFELIKGDVHKTIPNFIKDKDSTKIALLHLDMDVYEPTKYAINKLFERMSSNGIILIDDYVAVEGATRAIDEFLKPKKGLKLQKLTHYEVPSYIVVP